MWRVVIQPLLLFVTPFVLYALYLLARRRFPFVAELWTRSVVSTLTIAGLAAAVAGFIVLGLLSTRNQGAYVPAHIEDGRLAPGRFQ
ncbi:MULTISPECIES: DUF6111 family protein [Methylosinus]|uniref:ABC transporter permease n=1 Tax=Methylosinus trichosporium (strain ATCC 35070 / NCIMB 11131 / UNIQEM 75 / OB3b) TaxID=595536 RepID=A0A2D2D518_METT3|nr:MULTISPECIES: DUF6111 family protein [Methylosinus]ATQ70066.1 hypothetical protein CQW49_20875 [Methylosinus trichosporium OB3b]OBS54418.1 hypothetical protein A8B73_00665 [Methylosinus sp. 3S-1]